MRPESIESTVLCMRQRASQGVAVAALVGRAVGVGDAVRVGAADGDGAIDAAVVGVGEAVVAPVAQPAITTTRRALRSARPAIS
jgi:hypothetical protein